MKNFILAVAFLVFALPVSAYTGLLSAPDLKLGSNNSYVKTLQEYLNNSGYTVNPVAGDGGSKGNETTYFGPLTQSALSKFQQAMGISPSVGYFGPITRASISNSNLASGSYPANLSFGKTGDKTIYQVEEGSEFAASAGNFRGYSFGHILQNVNTQSSINTIASGGKEKGYIDQLYYNIMVDGYGGLPFGSCLQRSMFLTGTEKAKCAAGENKDLFRADTYGNDKLKNLLLKNITIKNLPRTGASLGGVTAGGFVNPYTDDGPHVDLIQSVTNKNASSPNFTNQTTEWFVIQDSVFKNSDNNITSIGDTFWSGMVYQNVQAICEGAFEADAHARAANDHKNFIGSTFIGAAPCGNGIGLGTWRNNAPVWFINVEVDSYVQVDNPFRNSAAVGPVIVVGNRVDVKARDRANGRWTGGWQNHQNVHYFDYIEDALAAGYEKPPYVELSCSGWRNPPAGCTSQRGYLNDTSENFNYLFVSKTGSGTVTSNDSKISCGSDCSEAYAKNSSPTVTLTASPNTGATFTGWSGACSGSGSTCTVTVNSSKNVTATFSDGPALPFASGNTVQTTANVNVRNTQTISTATLLGTQSNGSQGTLVEGPLPGIGNQYTWWRVDFNSGVDGWVGADNLKVIAEGTPGTSPSTYTLTVNTNTQGVGIIQISGDDPVSSNTNVVTYNSGDSVTIKLTDFQSGYTFTGWSGACTGTNTTCTIQMNGDKTVQTNFSKNAQALVSPEITSPSEDTVFPSDTQTVRVEWEDKNSNYLVRYTTDGSNEQQINTWTNEYYDIPVDAGKEYEFWVHQGVIGQGASGYSNPANYLHFSVQAVDEPVDNDSDDDGVIDTEDKCPNTPPVITSVNEKGCPLPQASNKIKFNTTLTDKDLGSIDNLEVEDKDGRYGKIKFNTPINLYGSNSKDTQIDIEDFIEIEDKRIYVKEDTQFDTSATVTLYNIVLENPVIYKDGVKQDSATYTYDRQAETLTFTVSGF